MDQLKNKRFYKGISLFIKSLILILSFYYIGRKITETSVDPDIFLFDRNKISCISLIICLMFVNWSLEALKWKILAAPLESISFFASLKAVFAGVTISTLTPNRVGEFAARVFFLQKADKIQASVASLLGSMMQLLVTLLAGLWAYFLLQNNYHDFFQTEKFVSTKILMAAVIAFSLVFFLSWQLYFRKKPGIRKYLDVIAMYPKSEINMVFLLSALRYVVFTWQYYLTLQLFGINGGILIMVALIALTFLATSAIPTFALTEIAVRTGTAVFFFSTISTDPGAIIASSLFLWFINIAVPAMAGSAFIWKIKLFKENI